MRLRKLDQDPTNSPWLVWDWNPGHLALLPLQTDPWVEGPQGLSPPCDNQVGHTFQVKEVSETAFFHKPWVVVTCKMYIFL